MPVNGDPKGEVNILGNDITSKERTFKTRQDYYTSVKLLKRKKWRKNPRQVHRGFRVPNS